jgi:RAB protein geranylgeranyltransferase component A
MRTVRVPCSRQEIFKSRGFGLSEKRSLTKFLQFCLDSSRGGDVERLNERELAQSRSLHRPQNKSVAEYDVAAFADRPFDEFLAACDLPPSLRQLTRFALALSDGASPVGADRTDAGIAAVQRHLRALGRYGNTAFLTCMYGSGELCQAFCRLSAVNGGVYMLRQRPVALVRNAVSLTAQPLADPELSSPLSRRTPGR